MTRPLSRRRPRKKRTPKQRTVSVKGALYVQWQAEAKARGMSLAGLVEAAVAEVTRDV